MTYNEIPREGFYWYQHKPGQGWTIFEVVKGKSGGYVALGNKTHPIEHLTGTFEGPLHKDEKN